ncbi:hypothetical protein OG887_43740 (plasmid) [Streptomyces sp. NBC_00053]|uniref:hypothetical protein n=1 Tax=unclassified Streptomyces TaxID=2593676 RepID=UPI002255883A|nr:MULTISPECIES: hypothetical protein [unclassified Streptomyces]MCX4400173.1 hypothetical protein [Streptomyces sp. NBC_01767]MCX5106840.1 hypothetical protein [Streptomyces sp. NBC_00439]MCX5506220.1 hypothetical protein [Streptomyces sp. NBC_00052]MCX5554077.1 hypothetical protein [Streptomyces sp. NBC_00051]
MPCELIERMAACDDCRNLAVDYGMNLTGSRRHNADPRHWELPLTLTRVHLDDHLITAHAAWLPDQQPDCGVCPPVTFFVAPQRGHRPSGPA